MLKTRSGHREVGCHRNCQGGVSRREREELGEREMEEEGVPGSGVGDCCEAEAGVGKVTGARA